MPAVRLISNGMRVHRRIHLIALLFGGVAVGAGGCGDRGTSDEPSQGPTLSTSSGGSEYAPTCREGNSCGCPDPSPMRSVTTCEDEVEVCDCVDCPDQRVLTGVPSFDACGGEPFGQWMATSTDWSNYSFRMSQLGCEPVTLTELEEGQTRLEFRDGGDATFRVIDSKLGLVMPKGCNSSSLCDNAYAKSPSASGSGFLTGTPECEESACNGCSCEVSQASFTMDVAWTRSGGTLSLRNEGGGTYVINYVGLPDFPNHEYVEGRQYEWQYCIEGDVMSVLEDDGRLITFERLVTSGTPLACDQRELERCSGTGCIRGACLGTGECEMSSSETQCLTYSGCSWDPDLCHGTAKEECGLSDHGFTPGCEILSPAWPPEWDDGSGPGGDSSGTGGTSSGEGNSGGQPSMGGASGIDDSPDLNSCREGGLLCAGAVCRIDSDCASGRCTGFSGLGWCLDLCVLSPDSCPQGTRCVTANDTNNYCYPACDEDVDCVESYNEEFACYDGICN